MRRLTLMAALAAALALAGCTLKTPEGAACDHIGLSDQCPEGQRCGADGVCSVAAVACGPTICSGTVCEDGKLRICVPSTGSVCATFEDTPCADHQICDAAAGTCTCADSICDGTRTSVCDGPGNLVTCGSGAQSSCPYEEQRVQCGSFEACTAIDQTSSKCDCKDNPEQCSSIGTKCSSDGKAIVTCNGAGACFVAETVAPCATGEECGVGSGSARCDCPATNLTPAAGGGCLTENALACNGTTLLKCVPVAGSLRCKEWQEERPCAGSGLVCGISPSSGTAACVCPQREAGILYADSSVDPQVTGLDPTGAFAQDCRFPTLKDALAAAVPLDTLKAVGTGPVLVFREAPLVVPSDVTLVGDESAPVDPTKVVIEIQGLGPTGVTVEAKASMHGLTIRRGTGAAATVGIEVKGASPISGPSLAGIRVDKAGAGGAFRTGVLVSGAGAVTLQDLTVLDSEGSALLPGSGLEVSRSTPADAVTVSGLLAKRNWIGVNLTVGELNLDGATIQKSNQQGIQAFNESLSQVGLGVKNSLVQDNLNGGVSGTNLARLEMTGTLVCFNSAPARSIPGSPSLRSLGGIVMTGGVPVPLAFTGNTVYGNTADQVAILGETGQVWNLNGAAPNGSCGPDRNVFTNYSPTATPPGAGLVVSNATVSAVFDAWPVTPALGRDYVRLGTAAIDVGTGPSRSDFCSVIAADLTCSTVPDLP